MWSNSVVKLHLELCNFLKLINLFNSGLWSLNEAQEISTSKLLYAAAKLQKYTAWTVRIVHGTKNP